MTDAPSDPTPGQTRDSFPAEPAVDAVLAHVAERRRADPAAPAPLDLVLPVPAMGVVLGFAARAAAEAADDVRTSTLADFLR